MKESYLIQAEYYLRRKNRFYFRNPDTKKKAISFELFGEDFDRTKKLLVRGKSYAIKCTQHAGKPLSKKDILDMEIEINTIESGYLEHSENGDVRYVMNDETSSMIEVIDLD